MCKGRHNSLLHFSDTTKDSQEKEKSNSESIVCSAQNSIFNNQVLLSRVTVRIFDNNNRMHIARALLDSGSQNSFITTSFAKRLNLDLSHIDIKVCGLNQADTEVSCLVVPQIAGTLPNFPDDYNPLQIPGHLQLADPDFCKAEKIDILLGAGADHFWHLICVGQEIEEVSTSRPLSQEENICESHFVETVCRTDSGQFIVTIPLKENPEVLGDSYYNAKKRLLSLERKFKRNPEFKKDYVKFINEYLALGHMSKVGNEDSRKSYFLPHHGGIIAYHQATRSL
ncbi:uncharacterized protein LOC115885014 [Sitophilus oryzae]|uniref:Uncharacterized protein LOC115885014 n=1 Tax=Sitophilus oryzae TaxID=7048 RepID=A0A6J2Y8W1_SITOR|nr:uncharacterized protein LOC115885014 [Sitophilus oryzae]